MTDRPAAPARAATPSGTSNLLLRILSAVVLAPIAVGVAWIGGWPFALFWTAASFAVLWEWVALVAGRDQAATFSAGGAGLAGAAVVGWLHHPIVATLLVALGALAATIFAPRARRLWVGAGVAYAGALLIAPLLLRDDDIYGFAALVLLFAVVWTTDVFAYFAGRTIGGPKLWPAVSPKKTWSGAIAGTVGAIVAALIVARVFGIDNRWAIAGVAFVLSALSQLGDLFESWVKRRFGAKDASQIIPGHGGVMDRLDGFWAAAVAAVVIGLLRGGFDAPARGLLVW